MDDKVYTSPVVDTNPIPEGLEGSTTTSDTSSSNTSAGVYKSQTTVSEKIPYKKWSTALVSDSFNSLSKQILGEYTFSQLGALAIGKFLSGGSGDVRITPTGIIARDINGDVTFAVDATTGNVTIKGELMAGSVITGLISVGDASVVIDGVNKRILVNDGSNDRVLIGKF